MKRQLRPELLDSLEPSDSGAQRSRLDLRRVNAWMGNGAILARAVLAAKQPVRRIVDIGAGDGTLLLSMARRLVQSMRNVEIVLLDRLPVIKPETLQQLGRLNCRPVSIKADIFEWLESDGPQKGDMVLANLFLHHFEVNELCRMFGLLACRVDSLIACEPRRSTGALFSAALLGLIGCNHVTRHDAVISVRAGFNGNELSRCWPVSGDWILYENRAGLFTHFFHATRKN